MVWILIVYHRRNRSMLLTQEYSDEEYDSAWARRNALSAEYVADNNIEVVLIGSGSSDEVRRTHGRYFPDAPSEDMVFSVG